MNRIGWILIFSLILKLVLSAWIPLSADEAYYWLWSHFPALSYYDHPPFVAWLYWLGQPLESFYSAVRWPGVLMAHLSLVIWIHILRPYLSVKSLEWFTWLALFSPLTGPGSIIITPDIPLIFFWALLAWGLVRSLENFRYTLPLIVGLCLGLGFLSKYTLVLFAPIALAVFILDKWPVKKIGVTFALAFLGFLLTSWPVWLWNIQNDWISFGFQIDHGLGAKVWKPQWTIDYVLAQVGLIFPTVLYFALKNRHAPSWLHLLAWFPIVFFFFTSFRGYAEANWPIVSYLPLLALSAWGTTNWKWARWTVGIWAVSFIIVLSLVAGFWLPLEKNKIKLKELYKYNGLVSFAESNSPIYARTYQMASKLSFELKRPIFKLRGVNRFDFFDLRSESLPRSQRFWYIAKPGDQIPSDVIKSYRKVETRVIDETFEAWRFEKE